MEAPLFGAEARCSVESARDETGFQPFGSTLDAELVVGHYTVLATGAMWSYVVRDGETESFRVPGSTWTEAWDINRRGEIVGNSGTGTLASTRGYLLRNGQFSTLHVPGATATFAYGVNGWGAVVGRFVDAAGVHHGYVAVPRPR